MSLGHVVNQLHDEYGFADSGAAEKADFAALTVGSQEVHHFDAGDQDLLFHAHLLELGGFGVDGASEIGVDGTWKKGNQIVWACSE